MFIDGEVDEVDQIRFYDMKGNQVLNCALDNKRSIEIGMSSPGLYFFQLWNSKKELLYLHKLSIVR